MKLISPYFGGRAMIPPQFTCDGVDKSPELVIEEVPEQAKSLALIMDDPDSPTGTFVHWVVWNIPRETKKIGIGEAPGKEGMTHFGKIGYGGPCPPSGEHRYCFKLYALDTELELTENAGKKELEEAMKGHVLEEAELVGLYKR